jgi:hypothetical protein
LRLLDFEIPFDNIYQLVRLWKICSLTVRKIALGMLLREAVMYEHYIEFTEEFDV